MSFLTLFLDWRTYAALAVAGMLATIGVLKVYSDHEHKALLASQSAVQALQAAARVKSAQDAAAAPVEAQHAAAQVQIQTVYRTLTERVPVYVPAKADAGCVIPRSAVSLLDAGVSGLQLPDTAGGPDGAPSPIGLSALVANALANDEAKRANDQQLISLQAWVRAQAAVKP